MTQQCEFFESLWMTVTKLIPWHLLRHSAITLSHRNHNNYVPCIITWIQERKIELFNNDHLGPGKYMAGQSGNLKSNLWNKICSSHNTRMLLLFLFFGKCWSNNKNVFEVDEEASMSWSIYSEWQWQTFNGQLNRSIGEEALARMQSVVASNKELHYCNRRSREALDLHWALQNKVKETCWVKNS